MAFQLWLLSWKTLRPVILKEILEDRTVTTSEEQLQK